MRILLNDELTTPGRVGRKFPGANGDEGKEAQPGEYRASDRETALVSTSGARVEHPRGRT